MANATPEADLQSIGGLAVAKPEWGLKRVCQSCSAKFYDMQRNPIVCPKCGATFDPDALLKSRRPRPTPAKAAAKDAAPAADTSEDDTVLLDDNDDDDIDVNEDDDAVLTNTDDLDGDSDLGNVVIEGDEEER